MMKVLIFTTNHFITKLVTVLIKTFSFKHFQAFAYSEVLLTYMLMRLVLARCYSLRWSLALRVGPW